MLNDWLFNAIMAGEILIRVRLDGGLERRLYELGRKHCGNQERWTIRVELLHRKSGSTTFLREFRHTVKMIVESDVLSDYRLRYQPDADQVLFHTTDPKRLAESFGPSPTYRSIGDPTHWSIRHRCVGRSDTGGQNFGWYFLGFTDLSSPYNTRDLTLYLTS